MIPRFRQSLIINNTILYPTINTFKRNIFKAIDNNYDMNRLKERINVPGALIEIGSDRTTLLHYLAGADPWSGLPTPLRKPPPKNFTQLLLKHYPKEKLNDFNVYGESALAVAARTGYSDVVQQLVAKKKSCVNEHPIFDALCSTVYFDPSFTIPNFLVKNGHDVNVKIRIDNCGRRSVDGGPLSLLVNTVYDNIRRARNSGNPLYSDLQRIEKFHFNFLPEKIEWLCQQGLKNEKDYFLAMDMCLFMMDPYSNLKMENKALRPVVPILAKYCNLKFNENNTNWPLLHKLVFYQCEEAVLELLKNGASVDEKDQNGLIPFDLAVLNMNQTLMRALNKEIYTDSFLSSMDPKFFGHTIMKLSETACRRSLSRSHSTFTTGLARVYNSYRKEKELLLPYYLSDEPNLNITPMALALQNKDEAKVLQLLSKGWNIFIEEDIRKHMQLYENTSIQGTEDVLYDILGEWKKGFEILIQASHSGVTLSNELDRAVSDVGYKINEKPILDLFEIGLNPDTFVNASGKSLFKYLNSAYWRTYSDERGFTTYDGYEEMSKVMEEVRKRGWE